MRILFMRMQANTPPLASTRLHWRKCLAGFFGKQAFHVQVSKLNGKTKNYDIQKK